MMARKIILKKDHALVPLSRGKFAIIDLEDVEFIGQWNWFVSSHGYARRTVSRHNRPRQIFMHKLINKVKDGFENDHINRNKLDNRKLNLRSVTRTQNCINRGKFKGCSSKYKGVSWHKVRKKFTARIRIDGVIKHLGSFSSELKAAKAYDREALISFWDYKQLNFRGNK